ncbi:hypothetical protein [Paludisphaera rhizosphaerae]|uniref:hypothetical protein n=1 Tax=Paludisphaera rhizosphaerae TaxID=2711216 RepID=UPI0013EA95F9|nr:hypothetical protein [Paludisphaera rhizosphaerae]
MNTLSKSLLALALVAVTASPALAQQRGGGGRGFGGGMMGGGGNVAMLLAAPGVQDELKLTEDQKSKVGDLAEKAREKMASARESLQNLEGEERMTKMRELNREANADAQKALADILKPEQVARLKGIQYQAMGVAAFENEELQKALKLTDAQKSELASIARDTMEKNREAMQGFQDDREGAMAKMRDIRKDGIAKAETKLTSEQKAEFAKILGAPFEVRMGGPGGPGGGRRPNN